MKHLNLWMLLILFSTTMTVSAGELKGFRYEDASKFRIINKGWDNTTEPYTRLPQQYMDSCRKDNNGCITTLLEAQYVLQPIASVLQRNGT